MSRTVSSREFNQDTGRVKRAAEAGPVFITDRGRPLYVLMTIKDFERLRGPKQPWVEFLGNEDAAEINFDLERNRVVSRRPLDLG
jgi:prevent-host-death family protein